MKITKGHYNRKLLSFGVIIFLAIALISTGFAAWIMSSGAEENYDDGNLTVGTITESDLEFTKVELVSGSSSALLFEPAKDDNKGDIKWDGKNSENLSFTISTTISPIEYLDEVSIKMNIPASVKAAHEAGYIVLPAAALLAEDAAGLVIVGFDDKDAVVATDHTGIDVTAVKETNDKGVEVIKITIKVSIAWGEQFKGENPSTYLDNTATNALGNKLTSDEKKAILYTFKRMVYGKTDASVTPDSEIAVLSEALPIGITLIATVN